MDQPRTPPRLRRLVIGRSLTLTLLRAALLVIVCALTVKFVLLPVRVTGHSMEPTFPDGQVTALNLLAYHSREPRRGDIIGFRLTPEGSLIIKRVLGLPGERIAVHQGVVFINGTALAEPYLNSPGAWEWPEETLGDDTWFVAGDNRDITAQFRVQRNQIIGRLLGGQH